MFFYFFRGNAIYMKRMTYNYNTRHLHRGADAVRPTRPFFFLNCIVFSSIFSGRFFSDSSTYHSNDFTGNGIDIALIRTFENMEMYIFR